MKSWFSKVSVSLALLSTCGTLSSCKLFGGGKYANQTEVETEVPDSLEQGKASSGPSAAAPANAGVPASSNLVDAADPWQSPTQPGSLPGGVNTAGLPSDGPRDLIEIPKPDFSNVSVHTNRPPAEMLSLGPPVTPSGTRMSMGTSPGALQAPKLVRETVQPMSEGVPVTSNLASEPKDADIAAAPKAIPGNPDGVPLLHGSGRLADFYKGLHEEILTSTVVENQTPPTTPAADNADALSVPPPPPDDTTPPPPPPQ